MDNDVYNSYTDRIITEEDKSIELMMADLTIKDNNIVEGDDNDKDKIIQKEEDDI